MNKKIILIFFIIISIFSFSYSTQVEELKKQIFYLKQKVKENKTKLYYQNLAKKDIERQLNKTWQELTELEYRVYVTKKRKNEIQKRMKFLSSQMDEIKRKIIEINNVLENKIITFLKYDLNFVVVIFSAKSPDLFLDYWYILKELIKTDVELISTLNNKKTELIKKNAELINLSKELENVEKKLESEKKYYSSLLAKRQELLRKYQEEINKTKQNIEYYESIQKEKYEELQRYIARNVSRTRIYRGGRFLWPTTSSVITSYFGYRVHPIWGGTRFHSGIDIGAPYGAPIYAAADGVVIFAGWYYGYGNTIIIDHGSGISTLYAHCSSISVYKGQVVSKGQVIGRVGSTGNSTGPHLHFEIQINGQPVNPLNYL
ncbi:MAG: murein hydrolase activator EnvC family protein [bacterium]